jgi:hypothetical protein
MNNKPTILFEGEFDQRDLDALKISALEITDIYDLQLRELFKINFPSKAADQKSLDSYVKQQKSGDYAGAWVYYPWSKILLHCVSPEELFKIRTNRNKNLITEEEQQILANTTVGVAGMSVGAGIAISLAYSGISNTIKIADFDELDTSNLNRLRENLLSVGKKKTQLASQHIYELDPFLQVEEFSEGLNDKNIAEFFSHPKIDVVIDEIDDFKMKIKLRLEAKKQGIPLLMFTSLGDNILIDVERYDLNPEQQPFHGLIGTVTEEILEKDQISIEDIKKFSVKVVGAEYIPTRALASVTEMGRSLVGRPQLYGTISIDGGLAAYLVRQIALSSDMLKSGRYFIKFSDFFKLNDDLADSDERKNILQKLIG